jgi:hypothetical protein
VDVSEFFSVVGFADIGLRPVRVKGSIAEAIGSHPYLFY